jgi:hypothetical protein
VCPQALPPGGWRLPTCRRLARCTGWIHIPFPWAGPPVPLSGTPLARPPISTLQRPAGTTPAPHRRSSAPHIAPHQRPRTLTHPRRLPPEPPSAPATSRRTPTRPERHAPHHAHRPQHLPPHPRRTPRTPHHVPTWTGSRINLVPVTAISPGGGQGPQSGAGHLSAAPSTILGRSSAQAVVQKEFDGPTRGNQPIYRRVDTISKQYQGSQHDNRHDNHHDSRHGGRYDSQCGDDGGGAPWES